MANIKKLLRLTRAGGGAAVAALGCLSCAQATMAAAGPWTVCVAPDNAFSFLLAHGGKLIGHADIVGWGPNWGWTDTHKAGVAGADGVLDATLPFLKSGDTPGISLNEKVSQTGPRTVTFTYAMTASEDVPLTQLSDALSFNDVKGTIAVVHSGGKSETLPLPTVLRGEIMPDIASATFKTAGDSFTATFDPPISAHVENNSLRLRLAYDKFPAGTRQRKITLTFPADVHLAVRQTDADALTKTMADSSWFAWKPSNDTGPSEIGMEKWLDAPAGRHGPVISIDDHFEFADHTKVKFWGTNLANNANAPDKPQAELTAARFAKYGINAVRMHKFLNPGWEGIGSAKSSLEFDPAGLDKLDYFTAQLKKRGVYFGWSHSYHYEVRPGDAASLLSYKEIVAANRNGDTYGLINGAPDIQNRMIGMVVALLKHRNPYTGTTYAADPALSFLEVQNEDDILFYTFSAIDKCPTYKDAMRKRFGAWLARKYENQAALVAAWKGALHPGEQAGGPVDIQTNPWFFSDDGLGQQAANPGARQRLLDNAMFFHDEQLDFYSRFVKAVRAAGYKGTINGSPWWAPTTLPQYLNLHADSLTGYIDRHNYFEGSDKIFATMLGDPGGGFLNTGLLQVAHRPFSLSEWCHVYPNALSAESPAIVAAYGMGLQGWDASYEFQSQSNGDGFQSDAGHLPWGVWSVDVPNQIGQFPSLSRMVARGDIAEGDVIAVKRVSAQQLGTGKFDFSDTARVAGDIKSFTGSVPQSALAAGKTLVEFTPATKPSTFPVMSKYQSGKTIRATNKQLAWDTSGQGYFQVMTPGTVGVVGFANGVPVSTADVKLTSLSPYASLFVTSLEKDAALVRCRRALITAVAKQCNTGFRYFTLGNTIVDNGHGPILVEGIKAKIAVTRPVKQVNVLDQDGRLQPGKTLLVAPDGSFTIDTGRDKTIYYEVVYR